MYRKEELLKISDLYRSRASTTSSRASRKAFQKMAEYYQHEAEQLQGLPAPEPIKRKQARSAKSAA
jgi:hypothetical protein